MKIKWSDLKLRILFIMLVTLLFALPVAAQVHDEHDHDSESAAPGAGAADIHPVKRDDGTIDLGNPKCFVSGKPVSGKHFQMYNGVHYGFCCNMCIRDFQKNPDAYALSTDTVQQAMAASSQNR